MFPQLKVTLSIDLLPPLCHRIQGSTNRAVQDKTEFAADFVPCHFSKSRLASITDSFTHKGFTCDSVESKYLLWFDPKPIAVREGPPQRSVPSPIVHSTFIIINQQQYQLKLFEQKTLRILQVIRALFIKKKENLKIIRAIRLPIILCRMFKRNYRNGTTLY